jgi:NADH-quinone oxidoreductase subunit E
LTAESKIHLLTAESRAEIDRWVAKYPAEWKQSAVMSALRITQDQNGGWLSTELMDAVAEYLEMEPIAVYEVGSFYSMLRGADEIVEHLRKRLGIGLGESTADGRFTLKEVECLGACGGAPMFQIGREYYENLTPAKIDEILEKLD